MGTTFNLTKMKVLFLDHDGVICLLDNWGSRLPKHDKIQDEFKTIETIPIEDRFDDFDKGCIEVLNEIIEQTDCEIVVSSDWRFHATLEELQQLYKLWGIKKVPISTTTLTGDYYRQFRFELNRAADIDTWLEKNSSDVEWWVAVDDINLVPFLSYDQTVRTGIMDGIKEKGIKEEIISKLNSEKSLTFPKSSLY